MNDKTRVYTLKNFIHPITLNNPATPISKVYQLPAMNEPAPNPNRIPPELHFEHQKVLHIIKIMNSLNLTPKKFLSAFLNKDDTDIRNRQALWVSPKGWKCE